MAYSTKKSRSPRDRLFLILCWWGRYLKML